MKHPRLSFLLCVISGLLSALAFSTHSTGWLIWFSFIPFFLVVFQHCESLKGYLLSSFFFGMSFYIGVVHWLQELHPLTWLPGVTNEYSLLIAYGGIVLIASIMSLWMLLYGLVLGLIRPQGHYRVIFPALLWVLMEWGQGLGEISLPWARLAVSQYQNLYLLQISSVTGHLFVDGLIIAFNAALALFLLEFVPDPRPKAYWHYPGFRAILSTLGVIVLVYAFGAYQLETDITNLTSNAHEIGVVQGSIPQGQKWGKDPWKRINEIEQIYMDHSYLLAKESQPEMIIWPESAVPIYLRLMPFFQKHFKKVARETDAYLLTGTFDAMEAKANVPTHNAAVLVTPEGEINQWYYKRQLVPFGEFFPYRSVLENVPFLGTVISKINPMKHDTTPGESPRLIDSPLGKIGTLICFESVYPQVGRESVAAGADLIVIITNDGWYRDAISLYQHLAHAVLRAIENERYVIRSGNTGISAFIDAKGRILNQTEPMERTHISAMVPERKGAGLTLYTRFGDWFVGLCFLLLGVLFYLQRMSHAKTAE